MTIVLLEDFMVLLVLVIIMFLLAFLVREKMTEEQKEKFADYFRVVLFIVACLLCFLIYQCSKPIKIWPPW